MTRNKQKLTPKKSHKPKSVTESTTQPILLIGDAGLVDSYAELCKNAGLEYKLIRPSQKQTQSARKTQDPFPLAQIPKKASFILELTNLSKVRKRSHLEVLDRIFSPDIPIISSSITVSASEQSSWIKHPQRLIGFGGMPGFAQQPLIEVAPTVHTIKETIDKVVNFFKGIGKDVEFVQDRVGLVFPRIICRLINESFFVSQEEIAHPREIDYAAKLGLRSTVGPIELGERIGFDHVYEILRAIEIDSGDAKYRISPLLKQMAESGDWWNK